MIVKKQGNFCRQTHNVNFHNVNKLALSYDRGF